MELFPVGWTKVSRWDIQLGGEKRKGHLFLKRGGTSSISTTEKAGPHIPPPSSGGGELELEDGTVVVVEAVGGLDGGAKYAVPFGSLYVGTPIEEHFTSRGGFLLS